MNYLTRNGVEEAEGLRESEAEYRVLFESNPQPMWVYDLESLAFLKVNPAAVDFYGYSREEFLAMTIKDIRPLEDVAPLLKLLKELTPGLSYSGDWRHIKKSGEIIALEIVSQEIVFNGRRARLVLAKDITARKRAEEALLKYEFIVNTSKDCMTLINRNYVYEAANAAFCQAHGKTCEEMVGTRLADIWGKDRFTNNIKGYLDRCFTGQKVEFEGWFEFGKKGKGYYHVFFNPYFNEDGTVAYAAVVSHDITERKKVERALRQSEAKYRQLVDQIPAVVYKGYADWSLDCFDRKIEEITGYTKEEFDSHGKTWLDLVFPEDIDRAKKLFKEALKGDGFYVTEHRIRKKNGEVCWIQGRNQIIRNAAGAFDYISGVFFDITERRELENQLINAQKMEAVGTLAGGIAHDFNNILTAILGNIGLAVLDGRMGPLVRQRLTRAEEACLRAQALSQQLLTFGKGGAPVKKIVSVPELLAESIAFACTGSAVKCEANFPENLWWIEADPGQIDQIFQNLSINAIQAMPTGGTIKIWAENLTLGAENDLPLSAGRYIKISVRDQGMSIPAEHLPKIFDPYFTTKQQGSGLGLATTYSIVKKHNGHIAVESKQGVGTTFQVYLPAVAQQDIPQPKEDKGLLLGKGKILVMDDEEMLREVLGSILSRLGYETELARDGAEAIEFFRQAKKSGDPFAAVILDLTVPGGMGGKETMERLLEIDPQVKGIVSSAYSDDLVMADFQKYGFSGVVAKPYKISELGKILHEVVMGKQ